MDIRRPHRHMWWSLTAALVVALTVPPSAPAGAAPDRAAPSRAAGAATRPALVAAAAMDRSAPLRDLARTTTGGGASSAAMPGTSTSFEGLGNRDNPFKVSPPDPNGEVGPRHYVEMVNVVLAVYAKSGRRLLGPTRVAELWRGFAVTDCNSDAGDPVVLYDQLADRWILTQLTANGPTYYACVAVSATGDPTGSYYRYAFSTGENFPDYPKYGVWPNAYFLATREFAPDNTFAGVGAYALERAKMIAGNPRARMVKFLVPPGDKPYLPGDGLLPSDLDGTRKPPAGAPNYFVGTQDDDGPYGAPFDAINIWQYFVSWGPTPTAAFFRSAQLPVAAFDSDFPCGAAGSRACIPQPDTTTRLDVLSYRQRPSWRLAYRNFGSYESLVTSQSVEARPHVAGVRWYEIRRPGGSPVVWQQSTFAPKDGVNRWMASVAQDKLGNIAMGYSVASRHVYPGIRYTGRLANDLPNTMARGEKVIVAGTGSQTGSSRWGDYTSMTVDPTDDCTFWYVNEYVRTTASLAWRTRIASFRLPGCTG